MWIWLVLTPHRPVNLLTLVVTLLLEMMTPLLPTTRLNIRDAPACILVLVLTRMRKLRLAAFATRQHNLGETFRCRTLPRKRLTRWRILLRITMRGNLMTLVPLIVRSKVKLRIVLLVVVPPSLLNLPWTPVPNLLNDLILLLILPVNLLLKVGNRPAPTLRIIIPKAVLPFPRLLVRQLLGKAMIILPLLLVPMLINRLLKFGTNRPEFNLKERPRLPLFLKVILLMNFLQLTIVALLSLVFLLPSINLVRCLRPLPKPPLILLLAMMWLRPLIPRPPHLLSPILGPIAILVVTI